MKSLGTLLVKHGWITKQQLGLAISKQREIGGRLGTCLLEMGAVEEDLLDRSLAEQQGVPVASADSLLEIPEKVSQLLPAPIAIRYRAIPFSAGHSEVDIAMLEVDNLWLQDELSFIVGRRLNVYITSEVRVAEALSTYYGAPLSGRFAKLLDQLNRSLEERMKAAPHSESRLVHSATIPTIQEDARSQSDIVRPDKRPVTPNLQVVLSPAPIPIVRPRSIPVSQEELESLEVSAASSKAVNTAKTSTALYSRDHLPSAVSGGGDVDSDLERVSDPEEVGRILLRAMSQEFTRVMLFKVSPSGLKGWLAHGPGLNDSVFEEYHVSFDQPSIFLNLREGGSFYLGLLPAMPAHLDLAACWSKDLSDECVIFPVRVRERLVALVYGDRGPLGLVDLDLDHIRHLTSAASTAFELCIVRQKGKKQQVSSG